MVLAATAVMAIGSAADGAVSLSLVPQSPGPYSPGPYSPGGTLDVDVVLVNEGEGLMIMRLLQIDVEETDPRIVVEDFELDFSAAFGGINQGYVDYSSGTVFNWTQTVICPFPCSYLEYPEGSNFVGTLRARLPVERGDYVLDVLNPFAPDNNTGANFQWDFHDTQQAWSGDGTLTGGRMTLTVIPEPATLLLLAAGAALARRREGVRRTPTTRKGRRRA